MRWVIIDLDALLVPDRGPRPRPPEQRATNPASLAAIARLSHAGYQTVMLSADDEEHAGASNAATLGRMHVRINAQLLPLGGRIQASLFCPHPSDIGCDCRPPEPGLLASVGERLKIDLGNTPVVSTRARDLDAARMVGAPAVRVGTPDDGEPGDSHRYADLAGWVEAVLSGESA